MRSRGRSPLPAAYLHRRFIALLNAERETNGLPADIVEDATWSESCARHNAYMELNGIGHAETPGLPGYSESGNRAGTSSVLSTGVGWTNGNPFATAPLHLMDLLDPRLSVTGVAESSDHVCVWTSPGNQRRFSLDDVYTVPRDGGDAVVSEIARERPFVPGDSVGLPEGTRTGPHLLVYAVGPSAGTMRVRAASLTSAAGQWVELRTVDNTSARVGAYLSPGAILIPVQPLVAGTDYVASISLESMAARRFDRTWWFRTLPRSRPTISAESARPGEVSITSDATNPVVVATSGTERLVLNPVRAAGGHWTTSVAMPGIWDLCVGAGPGPSNPDDKVCAQVTVLAPTVREPVEHRAATSMSGWPPVGRVVRVSSRRVTVRLRVPSGLVGQTIRVVYLGRCSKGRRVMRIRLTRTLNRVVVPRACSTHRGTIVAVRRGVLRLRDGRTFAPFRVVIGRG